MAKVIAVIPARYASSRFPGKPLADLAGKPMIVHVLERTVRAQGIDDVIVATDDRRIYDAVIAAGGKARMTDASHASGTDRVAEVAAATDADIIVNVQGDEPLLDPKMIEQVIAPFFADRTVEFASLKRAMDKTDDPDNPNLVKVVCDENDFALYFSRSRIPFNRDEQADICGYFAHIGIYAYRKDALLKLAAARPTSLEQCEKLEQLRILENGWRIKVPSTEYQSLGVDTPQDLKRANQLLQESD